LGLKMAHPRELHTCKYTYLSKEHKFLPLVELSIGSRTSKKSVSALVDTGCTCGLVISKRDKRRMKLNLTKISMKDPYPITLADGREVNSTVYEARCQIGEIDEKIKVYVMDTPAPKREKERPYKAFLGCEFLNEYDALFKGKKGELSICNPKIVD
jgi:predicted aspartyl protease